MTVHGYEVCVCSISSQADLKNSTCASWSYPCHTCCGKNKHIHIHGSSTTSSMSMYVDPCMYMSMYDVCMSMYVDAVALRLLVNIARVTNLEVVKIEFCHLPFLLQPA